MGANIHITIHTHTRDAKSVLLSMKVRVHTLPSQPMVHIQLSTKSFTDHPDQIYSTALSCFNLTAPRFAILWTSILRTSTYCLKGYPLMVACIPHGIHTSMSITPPPPKQSIHSHVWIQLGAPSSPSTLQCRKSVVQNTRHPARLLCLT